MSNCAIPFLTDSFWLCLSIMVHMITIGTVLTVVLKTIKGLKK